MSEAQQWVLALWLIYGLPSLVAGIALTLLYQRWRKRNG